MLKLLNEHVIRGRLGGAWKSVFDLFLRLTESCIWLFLQHVRKYNLLLPDIDAVLDEEGPKGRAVKRVYGHLLHLTLLQLAESALV